MSRSKHVSSNSHNQGFRTLWHPSPLGVDHSSVCGIVIYAFSIPSDNPWLFLLLSSHPFHLPFFVPSKPSFFSYLHCLSFDSHLIYLSASTIIHQARVAFYITFRDRHIRCSELESFKLKSICNSLLSHSLL